MAPRESSGNPEIGRTAGLEVLMDETNITRVRTGDKGDSAAGEIPWRTSRRLQEATYRLIQERDGGYLHGHDPSVKEYDTQCVTLPARSPKRGHCASESILTEEQKALPPKVPPEGCEAGGVKKELDQDCERISSGDVGTRRKRRRKVRFSDPLHIFIHDKNQAMAVTSSKDDSPKQAVSSKKRAAFRLAATETQSALGTALPSSGLQTKEPRSCFDLLCSHVGLRGWRCYRSCIAGQSFCIYHQSQSTTAGGISVCT